MGLAIRAGVEHRRGEPAAALRTLDEAERLYRATHMRLFAAAVRHQRAAVAGDDRGLGEAAEELRVLGVAHPARMASMLAPV
jgi:ATP/maltotriose-dependent transcriptional regulator MalT